ncbi:unnamed protein product [Rotaria sp. Silwood1]|nr:unnamed protein product [Rotaria sp. Silwood1]
MKISSKMIYFIVNVFFLFQLTNGQHRNYNFFMPDLPPSPSSLRASDSSISTIHKIHSFSTNSFRKINLSGGPFNVKLNQIINSNNNSSY